MNLKRDKKKKLSSTINPFLQQNFQSLISEGLNEVMKKMPDDPIKYLGEYFLKKAN